MTLSIFKGSTKPIREHGDAVLASLPVPDDELVLVEVHNLDAQPVHSMSRNPRS